MGFIAIAFAGAALAFSADLMSKNQKLTARVEALEEKINVGKSTEKEVE